MDGARDVGFGVETRSQQSYFATDFVVGTGTCSTMLMPNPSSAATRLGWLVSKRIECMFRLERICAPTPISRCVFRWLMGWR